MTHISSIGAGMYSDLSVCSDTTANSAAIANLTETNLKACFETGLYERVENVREFPAMGTPPNVVNVPVYGQATSQQIQGQADAPSIELQINYVALDWAAGTILGDMVGDGRQYVFRFSLLNSQPDSYDNGVTANDIAQVENSQYFWVGKVEALQVTPQLTDANTATVTITIQSDFYGAFTNTVV